MGNVTREIVETLVDLRKTDNEIIRALNNIVKRLEDLEAKVPTKPRAGG